MKRQHAGPQSIESYLAGVAATHPPGASALHAQLARLEAELNEQREFIRSLKENGRDRLLTLREAAKIAGVSYETMIAWANWKEIGAVNVAKKQGRRPRWRIPPDELQRFLRSRTRHRYEPPQRRRHPPPSSDYREYV